MNGRAVDVFCTSLPLHSNPRDKNEDAKCRHKHSHVLCKQTLSHTGSKQGKTEMKSSELRGHTCTTWKDTSNERHIKVILNGPPPDLPAYSVQKCQTATGCERTNVQQQTCTVTPDLCTKTSWCQMAFQLARGMKMEEQVNVWTSLPKQKQSMAQCLNDSRATAALCQG